MRHSRGTRRLDKGSRRIALAVALGLAVLAACGSGGDDSGSDRANPPIEGAPTLEVVGDNFRFEPAQLTVDTEQFNVALHSEDIFHTLVIEDADGDEAVASARATETDRGGVELEPGEYAFYCDVPGHREAGMEGTLVVQ
ncbi:MAG: plastocyanin/azurin family copper-binding protein [Acidimicrobiia bacterium]